MFEKKQLFRKNIAISFLLVQMENFQNDSKGEQTYFRDMEAILPFSKKSWIVEEFEHRVFSRSWKIVVLPTLDNNR